MVQIDTGHEKKPKIRPYWHVDIKWIFALLSIPILVVTFILLNIYTMTTEKNAIEISSTILGAMIAPSSQNTDKEIEKLRQTIKEKPDKTLRPFPGTDVKITEQDLDKYTPAEFKEKLFRELAQNIYNYDSSKMKYSPEGKSGAIANLGAMAIFTKEGHQFIRKLLLTSSAISLLLLSFLTIFSYGFGRIISPGLIFSIVGLPGLLLMTVIGLAPKNAPQMEAREVNMAEYAGSILKQIGPKISELALKNYLILTLLGLLLIIGGIIGSLILRHRKNKKHE